MNILRNKFFIIIIFLVTVSILFFIYFPNSIKKKQKINTKRYLNLEYYRIIDILKSKDISRAENEAVKIYKKFPNDSDIICLLLGDIYTVLNDLKKAEWYYREAININSTNIRYYVKLSSFYRERKYYNSSLLTLNQGINYGPYNPLILNEFGNVFFDLKNYDFSIYFWKKSIRFRYNNEIIFKIAKAYYIKNNEIYKSYINKYLKNGGDKYKINEIYK